MTLEMGKPVTQAKGEVELSAAIFEYYATKGPDLLADEILDIAGAGKADRAHRADRRAARDHALELPLLPGGAVRRTESVAGQHHPAQACRELPTAGAASGRTAGRGRCPERGLPERLRHHRSGRDDDRQPAAAGCFADRIRAGRQRGR